MSEQSDGVCCGCLILVVLVYILYLLIACCERLADLGPSYIEDEQVEITLIGV